MQRAFSGWFTAAMQAPEIKPRLAQQGLFASVKCGAAFAAIIKQQGEDYARVAREANITVQ